jgi:pimeloyl-ACP methyl ester carboxylesterase
LWMSTLAKIPSSMLPVGVRSKFVENVNGLTMHVLEAGHQDQYRPCVLLLHGFPELAYSWRHVLKILSDAGYHVIAPDQRGYGRTTGWVANYDDDLAPFRLLNIVEDAVALINAVGRSEIHAVIGHDFGSPVAAYCALTRPDLFKSVVLMSAPFNGPPAPLEDGDNSALKYAGLDDVLAALPQPRKHYQRYYTTRNAALDMEASEQDLSKFLRAYFHVKSGDWEGNNPFNLDGWIAEELEKMPSYYIMDINSSMPQTVAAFMPSSEEIAECEWLTDEELNFYAYEFGRTGFQGGLQWYRCSFDKEQNRQLSEFFGRTIDVPASFIGGSKDWGVYQQPGALRQMQNQSCTSFGDINLIPGAGHWVQQEQVAETSRYLLQFLALSN